MKIKSPEIRALSNSQESKIIPMTIGDSKIIADLLRKHYQNPRKTMIQEYLSNARDAHREIKQTKKIKVTLPTPSTPMLIIRDFGPGLSNDRLVNYFCAYASSTKRDSNEQTGGFGLGTKIAWAYRDNFFINNYHKGTKTSYDANISISYEGGLKELSVKETSEDDGVEIIIPIFPQDVKKVVEDYTSLTYFWKELDVVNLQAEELGGFSPEVVFETEDFVVIKPSSPIRYLEMNTWVLLDSIPYPLPSESLAGLDEELPINYRRHGHCLVLKFKSGELKPTIAREQLEASEDNLSALSKKFKEVALYLKDLEKETLGKFSQVEDPRGLKSIAKEYSQLFKNDGFVNFKLGEISLKDGKFRFLSPEMGEVRFVLYNPGECAFSKKRKRALVDLNLNYPFYFKGEGMKNIAEKDIVVTSEGSYVLATPLEVESDFFKKLDSFLNFKSSDELKFQVAGIQIDSPNAEYLCEFLSATEPCPEWKKKFYKASKVAKHMFVSPELKDFPVEVVIPLARQQKVSLLIIAPEDLLPEKTRVKSQDFFGVVQMKQVLDQSIVAKVKFLYKIIQVYRNYELIEDVPLLQEIGQHPVFTIRGYQEALNSEYYLAPPPPLSNKFLEILKVHHPDLVQLALEVEELDKNVKKFLEENPFHKAFAELVNRRWWPNLTPSAETKIIIDLVRQIEKDKK